MQTRYHQFDVFHACPCPPESASQRTRKRWWRQTADTLDCAPCDDNHLAIVVLTLASEGNRPPQWGIHFIGSREDYQHAYWDYLREHFAMAPHTHPAAPDIATLRKQLRASRKRKRWLTLDELANRGLTRQHWSLALTDHYDVTPPAPIRVDPRTDTLTVDLNNSEAVQAMIRHTLALKDAAYPDNDSPRPGYQLARLCFGLPFNALAGLAHRSPESHHPRLA
ncbi:MAG: hypothetical protein AWU57_540 [Marinobacter sp. T13-3]|nr:MAG: hypothetical protein AWU57_540 [Marinobacter sp. T13-3]